MAGYLPAFENIFQSPLLTILTRLQLVVVLNAGAGGPSRLSQEAFHLFREPTGLSLSPAVPSQTSLGDATHSFWRYSGQGAARAPTKS